jgi:chromatin remodeling complex protein RSC6
MYNEVAYNEVVSNEIVKIPSNVKKMEKAIETMDSIISEQHTRMIHLEKEFNQFKKFAASFIENIKKGCEKKPRKASGFVLPVPISDELCDFLDIAHGSQVSRTEVTKYLIAYISDHNLTNPEKRTLVVPDDKLGKLLGPDVDLETLTRFTIQKYMNQHYLPRENIPLV